MEQFRELKEYPGYKIGNRGTIIGKYGKAMKYCIHHVGYYYINVCNNGLMKKMCIHRLIALAWIPNPENKPQIDHINKDRKDNRIENLRWATAMENMNNLSISKSNTSGTQGLCFHKTRKTWVVCKAIMGVKHFKSFKERSEAEAYLKELVETPRFIDVDVSTK